MLLENLTLTTSEESRVQERVRVSFLRNRGNIEKVIREVNLPKEYVVKLLVKFRKACKQEGNRLVADQILTHLMFGYNSRVEQLMSVIEQFEKVEKIKKSTCCGWQVRQMADPHEDGSPAYECLKCNDLTDTYEWLNEEALTKKMAAIAMLRQEDVEMRNFSEKLGYTQKDNTPTSVINNTQNIVVMPNNDGKIDDTSIKEMEQLKPVEMEFLRQKIESGLLEAEIIEDNG
jgi:hypothetical protein